MQSASDVLLALHDAKRMNVINLHVRWTSEIESLDLFSVERPQWARAKTFVGPRQASISAMLFSVLGLGREPTVVTRHRFSSNTFAISHAVLSQATLSVLTIACIAFSLDLFFPIGVELSPPPHVLRTVQVLSPLSVNPQHSTETIT